MVLMLKFYRVLHKLNLVAYYTKAAVNGKSRVTTFPAAYCTPFQHPLYY